METLISGVLAAVVGVVLAGGTIVTAVNVATPDLNNPDAPYSQDAVIPYSE